MGHTKKIFNLRFSRANIDILLDDCFPSSTLNFLSVDPKSINQLVYSEAKLNQKLI
jgi:hypothetical protein